MPAEKGYEQTKTELLRFHNVSDKTSLLNLFYGSTFDKSIIASFAAKMAECEI